MDPEGTRDQLLVRGTRSEATPPTEAWPPLESDDVTETVGPDGGQHDAPSSDAEPPAWSPPGSAPSADDVPPIRLERPPRPGELSVRWRLVTALVWIGVAAALAAVWNTSVQLGLATWWLGPRSSPQPVFVRLLPFVPPLLMLLGTINQVRRLGWFGLLSAASIGVVGIIDLGYVRRLGLVEIAIAVAAAAASIATFSGTYRPRPS
jgi:hypothetical protein